MRTASLSLLAILALACHPAAAMAQAAPSTPAATPGGASAKEQPGAARINALSPDEERRLERARARSQKAAGGNDGRRPAADAGKSSATPAPRQAAAPEKASAPVRPSASSARAAATPVAGAASDRVSARRHTAETSTRGGRRASRESAGLDERRIRARPAPHAVVERRERRPRIGDVVPPGYALYPLPPGPPRYAGPAPIPFPGERDEYGYGPPRRMFMEPY